MWLWHQRVTSISGYLIDRHFPQGWCEQFICLQIWLVFVFLRFLWQPAERGTPNWKPPYTKAPSPTNLSSVHIFSSDTCQPCRRSITYTFSLLPFWIFVGPENLFPNSLAKSVSPASWEALISFLIVLSSSSANAVSSLTVGLSARLHCLYRLIWRPCFSATFSQ